MNRQPGKTYKIGTAARLVQVEPYVLRFWESEFPQLAPLRTEKGQRLYTEEDLTLIRRIKALLYDQGLTIEGARRRLEERRDLFAFLDELRSELKALREHLAPGSQGGGDPVDSESGQE